MQTSPEQKRDKPFSNPERTGLKLYMREKLAITVLVIMLALFALGYRLFRIQHDHGAEYNQKVLSQQKYDSREIPYRRGDIVDRNGTYLATTNKVYNLIIDPFQINSDQEDYLDPTVSLLTELFHYDETELRTLLMERSDSHYVRYAKQLTHEEKEKFEAREEEINRAFRAKGSTQRVYGVWFEDSYLRHYPYDSLACHVLGFSLSDGTEGSGGIEQYYNSQLIGTAGREYGYLNNDSNLERVIKSAKDGNTIVSTIDVKVQKTVEKYIAQFETEMGGDNVACIVMDPRNGEILGMATNHPFDLNHPRDLSGMYTQEVLDSMSEEMKAEACFKRWRNFCVSDTYEPGSTAKILTVASGMENGALTGDESFDCTGVLEVGGWEIHCSKRTGHGLLSVTESLMQSCNIAMMRIAQQVGKENFCKVQRLFGLGSRTGIDIPGEADTDALMHSPEDMTSSDLATNSFGQNFNCTMVQLAAAFASGINGGAYYKPHVVKQILNPQGGVIRDVRQEAVRETCSAETSAFLRKALLRTVSEGTGKAAGVEGYEIGGKTGTAEKYPRKSGNYLVSFCGFAPADQPEVLCYVIIDTPHTEDQPHSSYASAVFHNIMAEILPYLNIFPISSNEDADLPFALPEKEGISSTAETEGEETLPSYDTEEYIERREEEIPGEPAGISGENGETNVESTEGAETDLR